MCLSIPSKIVSLEPDNSAVVDTMGVKRTVRLDLIDQPVAVGDYVLIHIGYAMNKIDEEDALESLNVYGEIIAAMEAEERERLVAESDNCPSGGSA